MTMDIYAVDYREYFEIIYLPILSSQIACRTKPNRITKITQQSNVADFNIFIIIIIRKLFVFFLFAFSFL